MTRYQRVYDAFLAKLLDDEWENWYYNEMQQDWRQILEASIIWFKFPRISLDRDEDGFLEDLNNEEIQILAGYMKCEWLNRRILEWDNIKPMYDERDFSPANLLDKLNQTLAAEQKKIARAESIYYRSIDYKPFNYGVMATRL